MQKPSQSFAVPQASALEREPERGPVVLDLEQLAQVSGGLPKGGWETSVVIEDPNLPKGGW